MTNVFPIQFSVYLSQRRAFKNQMEQDIPEAKADFESFPHLEDSEHEKSPPLRKRIPRSKNKRSVPMVHINTEESVNFVSGESFLNSHNQSQTEREEETLKNLIFSPLRFFKTILYYLFYFVVLAYRFFLNIIELCVKFLIDNWRRKRRNFMLGSEGSENYQPSESGIRVVRQSPLKKWIRKTWRDRKKYYRKITFSLITCVIVMFFCMYSYKYVLAALSQRTNIGQKTIDDLERVIENTITPILLDKDSPVDAPIVEYITSVSMSNTFEPSVEEHVKDGYIESNIPGVTTTLDYVVKRANVSLVNLYHSMMEITLEKSRNSKKNPAESACVCAAHYGIPINVILTGDSKRIKTPPTFEEVNNLQSQWRSRLQPLSSGTIQYQTKMGKLIEKLSQFNDIIFMIDPKITSGSDEILSTSMSDTLTPPGKRIDIDFPRSIWVSYKDISGWYHKTKLSGFQSMCTIRCVTIATKAEIVNRESSGGIVDYNIIKN